MASAGVGYFGMATSLGVGLISRDDHRIAPRGSLPRGGTPGCACLAQPTAAHAQEAGQVPLRGQPMAGLEPLVRDEGAELCHDLGGHPGALYGAEQIISGYCHRSLPVCDPTDAADRPARASRQAGRTSGQTLRRPETTVKRVLACRVGVVRLCFLTSHAIILHSFCHLFPSFVPLLLHISLACFITASFVRILSEHCRYH